MARKRSLGDRLAAQRHRVFVGRAAELELMGSALAAEEPALSVLHIHGPGGVGKTALLRMFAQLAEQSGRAVVRVDGHDVNPNPSALQATVGDALSEMPGLLILDSYELLAPLDDWLREEFLVQLPAHVLVVIAGRRPPSERWREDPGWRDLLRALKLGNLPDEDALAYLAGAGVPEELRSAALEITGGQPLALNLVAEVAARGDANVLRDAMSDPDLIAALLSRLVEGKPDDRHRRALEVCALARVTSEPLLRTILDLQDVGELFGWLRSLAWIDSGPRGLYPHDLAREVLEADLRWRDDVAHRRLRDLILVDAVRRVREERGRLQQEAIFDVFFSLRFNPVQRRFWQWETLGAAVAEPVGTGDESAVLALIAGREGQESAAIASRWLSRQRQGFKLYRTRGELGGVLAFLSLGDARPLDVQADPVSAAAWGHATAHGHRDPGDEILVLRFQVDRTAYGRTSQTSNLVSLEQVQRVATRPRLTWSYLVTADPQFWVPHFTEIDFQRLEDDVIVGGHSFSIFAHDFRRSSWRWDGLRQSIHPNQPTPSRAEFEDAVKQALRDLRRADLLGRSPLLGLQLVRDAGGDAAGLRAVLVAAAEQLHGHPRDERLFRAVDRTYLRPAPTQEGAAELLGLPFSTYRRHLSQGVARVVEVLWEREQLSRN